jgi:hypothetical protein
LLTKGTVSSLVIFDCGVHSTRPEIETQDCLRRQLQSEREKRLAAEQIVGQDRIILDDLRAALRQLHGEAIADSMTRVYYSDRASSHANGGGEA